MGTGVLLAAVALLAVAALLVLAHGQPAGPDRPPARPVSRQVAAVPSGITPREFEQHCADALAARGWSVAIGRGTADQGVDVLARKGGRSVVLQCKLYTRPVGNKAVQEALAGRGYAGADGAAVVSNAAYTAAAHALAARVGVLLLHVTDLARADELFRFPATGAVVPAEEPAPVQRRPVRAARARVWRVPAWKLLAWRLPRPRLPGALLAAGAFAAVILLLPRLAPEAPPSRPSLRSSLGRPALPLPPPAPPAPTRPARAEPA